MPPPRSDNPELCLERNRDQRRGFERGVQEADHVGFPGPGRGGQALGVPGVRHDPDLHGGG